MMSREPQSPTMTGAESLIRSLEHAGVDTVFGIPGGAILPSYDPLMDSSRIRHILVRHEQAAGHAAEGYSYSSGKVGVCLATSGPGATNLVTPLANAYMDSIPLVAITGQVAAKSIGTDAFQEADICGISMPITKHNFLVTDPSEIPEVIAAAFHIAGTGRPGPVVVDVAKDAQQAQTTFSWPDRVELPGYRPRTSPHAKQIAEAASLMLDARRPVFVVGGGIVRSGAAARLLELVNLTGIPVVTTLMAKGAFPDSHPANLGMPGMHGTVPAVGALQRCDLIIALGTRFDDRVTGQLASFAPGATVIHADIDPAEIGKNVRVDVPIVGDATAVIGELIPAIARLRESGREGDYEAWWSTLDEWRTMFPPGYEEAPPGEIAPQDVISRIGQVSGPDAYYVTGVGQHQMWSSQFIKFERAGHWLTSGGLGTMGYCVPAAMGAKVGAPGNVVWGIDGDGSFQMTNQELATCTINEIPIKIAIINNGTLGMVRQWQTLFYDQRYSHTDLNTHRFPDFVKLAEAYGCHGLRCDSPDRVDATIERAMALNDAPVVVDFQVHKDAMVWPMVPAGTSNDAITIARDLAPAWDREE